MMQFRSVLSTHPILFLIFFMRLIVIFFPWNLFLFLCSPLLSSPSLSSTPPFLLLSSTFSPAIFRAPTIVVLFGLLSLFIADVCFLSFANVCDGGSCRKALPLRAYHFPIVVYVFEIRNE